MLLDSFARSWKIFVRCGSIAIICSSSMSEPSESEAAASSEREVLRVDARAALKRVSSSSSDSSSSSSTQWLIKITRSGLGMPRCGCSTELGIYINELLAIHFRFCQKFIDSQWECNISNLKPTSINSW